VPEGVLSALPIPGGKGRNNALGTCWNWTSTKTVERPSERLVGAPSECSLLITPYMRSIRFGLPLAARAATVGVGRPFLLGGSSSLNDDQQQQQSPLPLALDNLKEEELAARAAYRAWRQGSAKPPAAGRTPAHRSDSHLVNSLLGLPPAGLTQPKSPPRLTHDFSDVEFVSRGGFGSVYAGTSKLDGRRYALKIVPRAKTSPPAETQCLASLPPHESIVRYYGCFSEDAYSVKELRAQLAAAGCPRSTTRGVRGGAAAEEEHAAQSDESDESDESDTTESSASDMPIYESRLSGPGCLSRPDGSLVVQMELVVTPTLQCILQAEMATLAAIRSNALKGRALVAPPTHPHLAPLPAAPAAAAVGAAALASTEVRWRWVAGMASGLGALHEAGWLHNDLKPGATSGTISRDSPVRSSWHLLASPIL
jgi:hypothetical protein